MIEQWLAARVGPEPTAALCDVEGRGRLEQAGRESASRAFEGSSVPDPAALHCQRTDRCK